MTFSRGTIAIGNYDFRSSGTVAKSIEIASATVEAGLPAELWVIRASGPFLARVPSNVPVVEVGWNSWSARSRSIDLALCIPALSSAIRSRRPSVFLSGGNHLHLPAKLAVGMSGRRKTMQYGLRVSNSSSRPKGENGHINHDMRYWDRLKYEGADFAVAVSNDLADELRQADPSLNVQCVPNGVDAERVLQLSSEPFHHPFVTGRKDGRPLMIAMGRICWQKGFDILIRAMACLSQQTRVRLLVIGDGPQTEIAKLQDLAKIHGVLDDVDFIGYRANPFAVMSKADLFVSASRWEGASNALNEALVCGLPIVATDCPTGNREALKDGEYGKLVPVENPKALAHAIVAELSVGHRQEVQRKAAEELDLGTCLNKWVKLLGFHHAAALAKQGY